MGYNHEETHILWIYLSMKEGQKVKKTFLSAVIVALMLFVVIAFPAYAEESFNGDTEFLSREFYAPQSSDETFKSYFDADVLEARIRAAVMNYEKTLDISSYRIPASMLEDLYVFFSDSVTDCFHVNLKGCTKNVNTNLLVSMSFEYLVEKNDYDKYKAIWDAEIAEYLKDVDDDLTDVQKALVLHDRIILKCEYDVMDAALGKQSYTPYGVVINQSAVCQGYAELYAYLLKCVGIESYLCSSDTLNHIWNILVIDGEYYYVDVTWDDPVWDVSGRVLHDNFLCSYEKFKSSHNATDYDTTPSSTRFDDSFWKDCMSGFVLIDDEIYYVDFDEACIESYDGSHVWDVSTNWLVNNEGYYWPGCFTYLVSYEDFLFFNMPDSLYAYDTVLKTAKKVFTPSNPFTTTDETFNLFGFREKNGSFLLEFNSSPSFEENTKKNYTISVAIDPAWTKRDVASVVLNITEATLTEGKTLALEATVAPQNATNKNVTWSSSNEEVATVENGVVTAKKAGEAIITVTTEDGNKTASCMVTVKAPTKAYVYTEASKSAVQGMEFSYTVSIAGTYGGYSMVIPAQDGFTVTEIETADADINVDDLGDGMWKISVIPSCVKVDSEKTLLITVTVSVAKDAELGDRVLPLEDIFITDDHGDMVTVIETYYATINVTDKVPGDVNGDGKFNYLDVSKLYAVYRKKTTVSEDINLDINGDGEFKYTDVSKLYAIYRNKAKFN